MIHARYQCTQQFKIDIKNKILTFSSVYLYTPMQRLMSLKFGTQTVGNLCSPYKSTLVLSYKHIRLQRRAILRLVLFLDVSCHFDYIQTQCLTLTIVKTAHIFTKRLVNQEALA